MPAEKANATFGRRFQVLESIRRLSCTGRWVTQSDIVKDLRSRGYYVEKHNVRRDLQALSEAIPQIECHDNSRTGKPRRGLPYGYRWVGRDVVRQTGLSVPEALSMAMVERYLQRALPVTLTRALQRWFDVARNTLDLQKRSATARWADKIAVVPPTQPLLAPEIPPDVLRAVHEAVIDERQIKVTYRAPGQSHKVLVLHPLGLIQRGPATYLVATTFDYDDVLLYALHRIQDVEQMHQPACKPDGFVLGEYAVAQGHFGSGKTVRLHARVAPHIALILEETPLEPNQTLDPPDEWGWRLLRARVFDTWQLQWWLLSQGDGLEVVRPKWLREQVVDSLKSTLDLYTGDGS